MIVSICSGILILDFLHDLPLTRKEHHKVVNLLEAEVDLTLPPFGRVNVVELPAYLLALPDTLQDEMRSQAALAFGSTPFGFDLFELFKKQLPLCLFLFMGGGANYYRLTYG